MSFRRSLPKLHQAVLSDDVDAIAHLKKDPRESIAKDSLGFTAKEVAMLLGKRACLNLFETHDEKKFRVRKAGDTALKPYTLPEFEAEFLVGYRELAFCSDYETLQKVISCCPWLLKSTLIGTEHRRLGSLYRNKIFSGFVEDVAICFIDHTKGYGVFAEKLLSANTLVGTYSGQLRQIRRFHPELNNYCLHYPTKFASFHYFVIDAKDFGNEMRFINHSEKPNLRPFCLVDRGLLHIAFFTTQDIQEGEELTFCYGANFIHKQSEELVLGFEKAPGIERS